jgi:hypothetical protein
MLPLHGFATSARGFNSTGRRTVLRLHSPTERPEQLADMALIRSADEFDCAKSSDFTGVVVISDDDEIASRGNALSQVIQLPSKFEYLAAGDNFRFSPRH